MQRGFVHAGAWTLTTTAAVTLSWFGVHSVLAGTAYDPPRSLPISDDVAAHSSTQPLASSTHRPKPAAPPSPSSTKPATKAPSEPPVRPPGTSHDASTASATGNVHSYKVTGGRVALDLGPSSATLVSATPDSGWEMKVWKQDEWIRVDFTSGPTTSSVFCTWNGHPPVVEMYRG
ncbi:hypothetical protein QMK19_06585 [Streptomyces sp. H10-C2]|uniref:hypothetical protein n=1 Tax=unclassified Streptomyces TaxID=2593676 RepID=UPI0024B9037F|nr:MULTISPECIES: hypothetical protein [unclassified Streptomyces]MDJ0340012.1 hypothetical protein [Streptomyces sp. PH10-H1]MDJ0369351.1 hypothetical protein [Streptomyces sp. H10-C2]